MPCLWCLRTDITAASWGLRPRRLLRRFAPPPAPSALPPGIPQGYALGLRPHPSTGPQRGLSRSPNRAGGYRPPCQGLRPSLFDPPGRGFAPPHRCAAVPLPNSQLSRVESATSVPLRDGLCLRGEQASAPRRALWKPRRRQYRKADVPRTPSLRPGQGRAIFSRCPFVARHSHGGRGSASAHNPRRWARASSSAAT